MKAKAMVIAAALVGATLSGGYAAADNLDACGQNDNTCLFRYNDYVEKMRERGEGQASIDNLGSYADNRTSSWANNSETYKSCGYQTFDGGGDAQQWNELAHDPDMAPWNDNEVSSWRTKYGC